MKLPSFVFLCVALAASAAPFDFRYSLRNAGDTAFNNVVLAEPGATRVLQWDNTNNRFEWAALAGGGDMLAANNLSDVANVATSRTNIGAAALAGGNTFTGTQIFSNDVTLNGTTTAGTVNTTTLTVTAFEPATDDGVAIGNATTKRWSDLFLAEGGVINWDNGDATLTQSGNSVTLAGADLVVATLNATTVIGAGGAITLNAAGFDGQLDVTDDTLQEVAQVVDDLSTGGAVATDAIFDAKGDLPVGTGANTSARLPVGTNGHVLTADDAEATGVKWAPGGSGSSPTTTRGDLIRRGAAADERLALGSLGSQLISDGTDAAWDTTTNVVRLREEFIARSYASQFGTFGILASSGTPVNAAVSGRPGVLQMTVGAGTTDNGRLEGGVASGVGAFSFGGGRHVLTFSAKTPVNLSTAVEEYDMLLGFGDALDFVDGIYFEYNRNESATNWRCGVSSASTRTESEGNGTPVAVAANTWYKFIIDVNAGATEVKFYIDGVLVHTESGANIPDSTTFSTGLWFEVVKGGGSTGTATHVWMIDYVDLVFQATSAR